MTRLEKIKSMTRAEMIELFCDLWLASSNDHMLNCHTCPMSGKCNTDNAGWGVYLDGEWDDQFSIGM